MQKLIMVKYGELTTKKNNRNYFIRTLEENILRSIDKDIEIRKDYYRMFIYAKEEDFKDLIEKLKKIFGIYEIAICYFSEDKSIENIKELSKHTIEKNITFKVETNRSDKAYPIKSMEVSRVVGFYLKI